MTTYAHKQIIQSIDGLDQMPQTPAAFKSWILAKGHLDYLQKNANQDELIIYVSGPYSFIHSIAVPADALASEGVEGLLSWNSSPFTSIAGYAWGGGRENVWIERGKNHCGSPTLDAGTDLIFGRTFEGWSDSDRNYFEVNQEYTHLAEIHWRPERSAYCRFDENGDLADLASISIHKKERDVALVSFTWEALEQYLGIAGYVLVRMFDFTLLDRSSFGSWGGGPEAIVRVSDDFLYRQKVVGSSAYTRGVQIIRPRDARILSKKISAFGSDNREYVTFIANDWRNNKVVAISTDPAATTNYFVAKDNELPFEVSPAFFRPEVLSKYKTDRDKYIVSDRELQCRASWTLRAYDVNEAGQVFAYIRYLRDLPHNEQLHWKSFNEPPKAPISERALVNDFEGRFVSFQSPRAELLSILQRWHSRRTEWWTLREEDLLNRANPPISSSKDEWGEAVMDLSKLVVEGFEVKFLRSTLSKLGQTYNAEDKSIALFEKIVAEKSSAGDPASLHGLRMVQYIRSKVKGHSGSSEGKILAQEAIAQHGSYGGHFGHLCKLIVSDLDRIESALVP